MYEWCHRDSDTSQKTEFEQVIPVGSYKVRIHVSHDTSYAYQSQAWAEVWHPQDLRWNRLAIAHHAEGHWSEKTGRLLVGMDWDMPDMTEGIEIAQSILVERCHDLLLG